MSQENVQIEDRLHSAGYKTVRDCGIVQVFDPVHSSVAGSKELVLSAHTLKEIHTIKDAWAFIEARK